MVATAELRRVLDEASPTLPFAAFTELFGARWGVDPAKVRAVLLGAAPLVSLDSETASHLLSHVAMWETLGSAATLGTPGLVSSQELLASESRDDVTRWAHDVPAEVVEGLAEAWATLCGDRPAKLELQLTADAASKLLLAWACTTNGSFYARVAAVHEVLELVALTWDEQASTAAAVDLDPLDASRSLYSALCASPELAVAAEGDRRAAAGGFCGCGGAGTPGKPAAGVVPGAGAPSAGVPGCDGGCGSAAVLAAALARSSVGCSPVARYTPPVSALRDAAAELGAWYRSDEGPEALQDDVGSLLSAVGCLLGVHDGDPEVVALPFGAPSVAELDDDEVRACLYWWYVQRPLSDDDVESVPPPASALDGFLVAVTCGGDLRRDVEYEVLSMSSPELPVRVAAALWSSDQDWGFDHANEFCFAAAGRFGHRWDAGEVLEALAGAPELLESVLVVAPGCCAVLDDLGVSGVEMCAELIDASLEHLGWGQWLECAPQRCARMLADAVDGFVAAASSDAASSPPEWLVDLWATVWSLVTPFRGSAAELVAVAAASTHGVPSGAPSPV